MVHECAISDAGGRFCACRFHWTPPSSKNGKCFVTGKPWDQFEVINRQIQVHVARIYQQGLVVLLTRQAPRNSLRHPLNAGANYENRK
jgi:hypothetical protein